MKTKLLSLALVTLACFLPTHIVWAGLTFQLLHEFNPTNSGPAYPGTGLAEGKDGNFYGTTSSGGTNGDYGTVFRMRPGGVLTTLLSFNGTNGSAPAARLLQGSDGHFYGTTAVGGLGLQWYTRQWQWHDISDHHQRHSVHAGFFQQHKWQRSY